MVSGRRRTAASLMLAFAVMGYLAAPTGAG